MYDSWEFSWEQKDLLDGYLENSPLEGLGSDEMSSPIDEFP